MRLPSVGVVLPTLERPLLLAEALEAVLAQTYTGHIEVAVVYDRGTPDPRLARAGTRPVRLMSNDRTPGLAGARNSGILGMSTDLVAFCDDDDVWLPHKLATQVAALQASGTGRFSTCAISVDYRGQLSHRLARRTEVRHEDLLRSRMSMLHSSTFLADRTFLVDVVGLLDEEAPGSQNEDWDLLLRATEHLPIVHVDSPLVRVRWGVNSYFARQWQSRADSLSWMLQKHPDIMTSDVGSARVFGQLAFAHAAMGSRRESRRWAARALRANPGEWRAVAALSVAVGVVAPGRVLDVLHRYGRGV